MNSIPTSPVGTHPSLTPSEDITLEIHIPNFISQIETEEYTIEVSECVYCNKTSMSCDCTDEIISSNSETEYELQTNLSPPDSPVSPDSYFKTRRYSYRID